MDYEDKIAVQWAKNQRNGRQACENCQDKAIHIMGLVENARLPKVYDMCQPTNFFCKRLYVIGSSSLEIIPEPKKN